eukprot:56527_1
MANRKQYKSDFESTKQNPSVHGPYDISLSTSTVISFSDTGLSLIIPSKKRDNNVQYKFIIYTKKRNKLSIQTNSNWIQDLKSNFVKECKNRHDNNITDHFIHIAKHKLTKNEIKCLGISRINFYKDIMRILLEIIKPEISYCYSIPSNPLKYLQSNKQASGIAKWFTKTKTTVSNSKTNKNNSTINNIQLSNVNDDEDLKKEHESSADKVATPVNPMTNAININNRGKKRKLQQREDESEFTNIEPIRKRQKLNHNEHTIEPTYNKLQQMASDENIKLQQMKLSQMEEELYNLRLELTNKNKENKEYKYKNQISEQKIKRQHQQIINLQHENDDLNDLNEIKQNKLNKMRHIKYNIKRKNKRQSLPGSRGGNSKSVQKRILKK